MKDARGVRLELQPVGEVAEARLILRGVDVAWWCSGDELPSYLRLEAIDAQGNVVANSSTCGEPASDDEFGHSWMMSIGDTIALGRLEIACATKGSGFHVTGPDGLCLDVPDGARLRATWDASLEPSQIDRCRQRAEARWYAASAHRQQVPWRPPDSALHRRFPVDPEDLRTIESLPRLTSNELALVPLTWEASK